MKDIGEYATEGLKLAGRGTVYVVKSAIGYVFQLLVIIDLMRWKTEEVEDYLDKLHQPKGKTEEYRN